MISEKEFRENNKISKNKLNKMLPYIKEKEECPACHRYMIPENIKPLYVPDKRKYGKYYKKYCYILDAIESGTIICEGLTGITENECESLTKELFENGLIVKTKNKEAKIYDYKDFTLSLKAVDWNSK